MTIDLHGRHFLKLLDFDRDELQHLLDLATSLDPARANASAPNAGPSTTDHAICQDAVSSTTMTPILRGARIQL